MRQEIVVIAQDKLEALIAGAVQRGVSMAIDGLRLPETMTEAQAATYLCLSQETLRRWRTEGRGPAFQKLGRAVRYLRSELDAWQRGQRQRTV